MIVDLYVVGGRFLGRSGSVRARNSLPMDSTFILTVYQPGLESPMLLKRNDQRIQPTAKAIFRNISRDSGSAGTVIDSTL
jgi:hypothetical protein